MGHAWPTIRSGGPPTQISRFGSRPAWSPDGTRIAFQGAPYTEPSATAFETFGPSSLWVVEASGGTPRRATQGWRPEGSHVRPTWFPDGRRLFFASQRLDTTVFWSVDLDSGALTQVLDAGARALDAVMAPDGRAVYYVRMDDHFDLWTLPLTSRGAAAGAPQLLLPPSELDVRHVAVHPRGDQVAYVAMATLGGLRSLSHLAPLMMNLQCWVAPKQFALSKAGDAFTPDGQLVAEPVRENVRAVVEQVLWATRKFQG